MKIQHRIGLLWVVYLVMLLAVVILFPSGEGRDVAYCLLGASSALTGIVSFYLWKMDIQKRARWMFLNVAVLFAVNAFFTDVWDLVTYFFALSGNWLEIFSFQYGTLLYFSLLFICVLYILVDDLATRFGTLKKYVVTLAIAGTVGGIAFYPFLLNPKFLLTEPSYSDFRMVRDAVRILKENGTSDPTPQVIATNISSEKNAHQSSLAGLSRLEKERRVEEILPYLQGYDGYVIFYNPLWIRCSGISMVCVLLMVWVCARQYLVGSGHGAYVEKIVWCLMLYSILEALHLYAYTEITSFDTYVLISISGKYLSIAVMMLLCGLLALRLRFIQSVEGGYYEKRLTESAESITRWRDSFDNWAVRQFMRAEELDRRFAVRRRSA